MNCPKCGKLMEDGFVQAGARAVWVRKKHLVSLLPKKGEVELAQNLLGYCAIPATICKECKTVLMDYSETECQD